MKKPSAARSGRRLPTVIIIGLGLVQMTVLARIIDNHQFGLLTVSLVSIALADTLSDFGIANSIIQRKEISHLELTTLYWLNVGAGACGVRGGVFVE